MKPRDRIKARPGWNDRSEDDLGARVNVGAGSAILGRVTIGDDAAIGANAVVLVDVPTGALATGVPARVRGG